MDTTAIVLLQLAIASVTGTQAAQVGVAENVKYHLVDLVWADADYSNSILKSRLAFLVALRSKVIKRAVDTMDGQKKRTRDELSWIVAYVAKNVRQLGFPQSV